MFAQKTTKRTTNYNNIVNHLMDNNVHLDDIAKLIELLKGYSNKAYVTHCEYEENGEGTKHKIIITSDNELKLMKNPERYLLGKMLKQCQDNIVVKYRIFSPETF